MILKISVGAFVLSQEAIAALEELRSDRLLFRSTVEVTEGGMEAALSFLQSNDTPQLLIIETSASGEAIFEELTALADVCSPNTRLVLIGVDNDIGLFKELIGQGISEYMVPPVSADQIVATIRQVFAEEDTSSTNRTLAVTGVRGGTGSSIIAHNIAWEIATKFNEDVAVIDLDLTGGTAALNYNIQPKQTVADALSQTARLDSVILERFMVECGKNLALLASPATLESGVFVTAENLDAVLRIVRRMYSYVVLDIPYQWTAWTREALLDADETILVATPDLVCMRDTKSFVDFLGPKRGVDAPMRLILNRMGERKKTELSAKDFKESAGIEPTIMIPYDANVFGEATTNGEMLSNIAAKGKTVEAIRSLAARSTGKIRESTAKSGGIFSMFKKS